MPPPKPRSGKAEDKPARAEGEPQSAPTPPVPAAPAPPPAREGPDQFQDPRKRNLVNLDLGRPPEPVKRARMLDPRLMPLVPAAVTTDPSRQFHALLGLPPSAPKGAPAAAPAPKPPGGKADVEALLASLSPARAKVIRQILSGRNTRLRRALVAFIDDARFCRLDFEQQRRALAAFDLRWP